jgi:hypothetical protein
VRRFLRGAAIVWSVVALVAHSDTGVAFPLWMLLEGTCLVLFVVWLVALMIAFGDRRRAPQAPGALRAWLGVPLPVVAAFVAIWLALPLKTRLFLSGPALVQSGAFLNQVPAADFQNRPPWVGLFRIRGFSQFGSELRFLTSDCGLVDSCGLVYSPGGPPPNRGEDTFDHLYAEWWHWHQSW